jgi:hypothetical protein
MQKPSDQGLVKALEGKGVYFNDTLDPLAQTSTRQILGVTVEFAVPSDTETSMPEFGIYTKSPRGTIFNFGDWSITQADGCKILSFSASCQLPEKMRFEVKNERLLATTFADLCMNSGVESLGDFTPSVNTPMRSEAVYEDFSWYLPAYFTDHLIDALGKMNVYFLDGALEHAMIYGIISK